MFLRSYIKIKRKGGKIMKKEFMEQKRHYDPVEERAKLVVKAEKGLISGKQLYQGLRAWWADMDAEDKERELVNIV